MKAFVNRPPFAGETYSPTLDETRLRGQLAQVRELMSDRRWRTLSEIRETLGEKHSEAGISARLRDLRKKRFGEYLVERRRRSQGTFEYRVLASEKQMEMEL